MQRPGEIVPPTSQDTVKEAALLPPRPRCRPVRRSEWRSGPRHGCAAERADPKPAVKAIKPAGAQQREAPTITGDSTAITVRRNSEGLRPTIPFAPPTPAAMFVRADAVSMIFDSETPLDVSQITRDGGAIVRDALRVALQRGQAIRRSPEPSAAGRRVRRR